VGASLRASPRTGRALLGSSTPAGSCVQPGSDLVDLGRGVRTSWPWSCVFPKLPVPPVVYGSSFPHGADPFQSPSRPPGRPTRVGPAPPRFLVPRAVSLELAPSGAGRQSRPGSAHRFSQPLSGFLARPSFAALSHAATVLGSPPSEPSPRRNRAPLSGPPAPLRSSTSVRRRTRRALSPLVSPDIRARARQPRIPARL
jgi:hypothetical protein